MNQRSDPGQLLLCISDELDQCKGLLQIYIIRVMLFLPISNIDNTLVD